MQEIDQFSFQCGIIDCFNEMVRAGVKTLAISPPLETKAERDALLPFVTQSCNTYGTQYYIEDAPFLSDLFPISLLQGKYSLIFYLENHALDEYLRLKAQKAAWVPSGAYFGGNRSQIARQFGRLLSYTDDGIRRLMANNTEKES